jgi:hypothetical protein
MVLANGITIVNYDCKEFIVQATGLVASPKSFITLSPALDTYVKKSPNTENEITCEEFQRNTGMGVQVNS